MEGFGKLQDPDSLDAPILEYCNKFGMNPRLKKYLRIHSVVGNPGTESISAATSIKASVNVVDVPHEELPNQSNVTNEKLPDTSSDCSNIKSITSESEPVAKSTSIKRTDRRLEWDSLADVGYRRFSETEKSAFVNKAELQTTSTHQHSGNGIDGHSNSWLSLPKNGTSQKENWRKVLESVKKKYDNNLLDTSQPSATLSKFNPPSFSTLSTKNSPLNKTVQIHQACGESTKAKSCLGSSNSCSTSRHHSKTGRNTSASNNLPNKGKYQPKVSSSTSDSSTKVIPDLEMGVNLLCLLIESKKLLPTKKEKLIRKIVSKISGKEVACNTTQDNKSTNDESDPHPLCTSVEKLTIQERKNRRLVCEQLGAKQSTSDSHNSYEKSNEKCSLDQDSKQSSEDVKSPVNNARYFVKTWLDQLKNYDVNCHESHRLHKTAESSESSKTTPTPAKSSVASKHQNLLVDAKESNDFVPTGYRSSSELMDLINNKRISHLDWIEFEIQQLENLKQLLVKSKITFTPTDRKRINAFVQNVYDQVASRSTQYSLSSRAQMTPVYQEVVMIEKGANNRVEGTLEQLSEDVQEEDERNGSSSGEHAEKQFRSKLETPEVPSRDTLLHYDCNKKYQSLRKSKETRNSAENEYYSEPLENASKPNKNPSDVEFSTGSSNFIESSGSISISGVTTSTSTNTASECVYRKEVAIQTSGSFLESHKWSSEVKETRDFEEDPERNQGLQSKAYNINFDSHRDTYTLREHLEKCRPDLADNINRRCEILKKLRILRKDRYEKIREIIKKYSTTDIPRKLEELPPQPRNIRIFSINERKNRMKKKFLQQPEVLERKQQLIAKERKRSNRILADVFNKKMQQYIRSGKLNFNQSMTII